MSIELVGPQGYEYQYLVTVYIALLHLKEKHDFQLVVEKAGGEDAELRIRKEDSEFTVEIQVKSTREDLTVKELTEWLSHFPDRGSENNLIDRLKLEAGRFVLFVTRARATDLIRPFLTETISVNENPFNNDILNNIIHHLTTTYGNGTELETLRSEYCKNQADFFRTNRPIFRSVAKRSLVWEQKDQDTITMKCREILHNAFVVPQSEIARVLLELLDLVKRARDSRENVMPSIKHLLDQFNGERININHISIKRESESELIETLETRNALFLTGISFCGKTHLAREIARRYQDNGYKCIIESDIKEVARFLNQISIEDRLCLIEDPFGQVELEEKYYELWAALSDVIAKVTPNKKVIVMSKSELLRGISKKDDPDDWMIHGHKWNDLTVRSHELIVEIWDAYCTEKKIPKEVYQLVKDNLLSSPGENLLQPGQLRYLAYNDKSVLLEKSFDQLVELATFDAHKLGMYFETKSADFKNTLITLGLGASPTQPIKIAELSYILSTSTFRPSIVILEDNYKSMSFPGKESATPSFPLYDIDTKLPDSILAQLDELESHGYITIMNDKIVFSHPTYHEAAKYLIVHQLRLQLRIMVDILSRGVACLETNTALSFIKSLNKLFLVYSNNRDFQKGIISIATNALSSIFPSVRDVAIVFLVLCIDQLEPELQSKVFSFIKHDDIDNERLLWHNGEPWIEIISSFSFLDRISYMLSLKNREGIEEIAHRLIDPAASHTVSSEEAWAVVSNGFLFEDYEMNILLIKQLLTYKESFVREKAAFIFIESFSNDREEIVSLVFNDEHPNVVYQCIRGALNGWKGHSEVNRARLLTKMKRAMLDKIIAAKANKFMVDFGDEYGTDRIDRSTLDDEQKRALWGVWSELFSMFLQSVPDKFVSVNESHLFNTVENSINYVTSSNVILICESWLNWIERNIQSSMLHEVGYAVADYLLVGTKPEEREHLTERIINQQDTNFLTVSLAEYIKSWNKLSDWEKERISVLLQSEREDLRWLKAISLTRSIVPSEISSIILGEENKNIFNEDIEKIIVCFPPELLIDCISVYIGHPQPLWWLGYHHVRSTKWPHILLKLIEIPEHPAFTIAIKDFVDKFIYGDFQEEIRNKVIEVWADHVKSNNDKIINLLFDNLEMGCITYNGPDCEELWVSFFDNISMEKMDYYLSKIVEKVEAYSYFNDLDEVFGKKIFYEQILPRMQIDYTIINFIIMARRVVEGSKREEIIQATYDVILKFYANEAPRLELTHKIVKNFFKDFITEIGPENELMTLIDQAEKQSSHKGRIDKERFNDHYDLDNWVSVQKRV